MAGGFARCLALLLGLALLSVSGLPARAAFVDGKRYLAMSDEQRTMYMAGLADMMARMVGVSVPDEMKRQARFERCLYNMTEVQVRELMDAFMREDPSTVQYTMASNFRAALDVACPAFPASR